MKQKKVLLLGGNGYIGCRLYEHFLSENREVVNVDICVYDKVFEETVVENYKNLSKEFISQFSHVILLAGHSSVSMCGSLSPCFQNNVVNFIELIEKLQDEQVLIYSSTAAVYGSNPNLVDESYPLTEAINFYDYTKICNESIMKLYEKKIIGLRFGSVGGFSKNFRKENLMNSISVSASQQNKIVISNPDKYRSVLGINDLCRAFSKIIDSPVKERIYNLTSINAKIIEFGQALQKKTGCELVVDDTFVTNYSFNCDNSLFKRDYDFEFTDTIETIYQEIVENFEKIQINVKRESITI